MTTPNPTHILRDIPRITRLLHNAEQHLKAEQAEAILTARTLDNDTRHGTGSHADPTPTHAQTTLARYHHARTHLNAAYTGIQRAIKDAEQAAHHALNHNTPPPDETPRCPGWSPELQAQLGGCGKIVEHYRLKNGDTVPRPEGLCASCRTAQRRHNQK